MTDANSQPALAQLLTSYLRRQGTSQVDLGGEVVPFEAAPAQPVDAALAWREATTVLWQFRPRAAVDVEMPPDWPGVVAAHEPAMAVACSAANFPQLVRDLHPLLNVQDGTTPRPAVTRPVAVPGLLAWAEGTANAKSYPERLLACGVLRLTGAFDRADELLAAVSPPAWQPARANEEAALAWHRGRFDEAAALWQKQRDSAPVHFNRGMAALFLGRPDDARAWLAKAVAALPETSGWHHLAGLYLALTETRAGH